MHLASKTESVARFTNPSDDDVFVMPASVAQERYWLLDQLEPGSSSLNMPLALRLTGVVDGEVLRRTLDEIVARHEILRTTFLKRDGELVQVIDTQHSAKFDIIDLRDHADPEAEADRLIVDEAHVAFDLAHGPLFVSKLLRLSSEEYILLLTLHHIVCDGWSNGVLVREIGEIYDAFAKDNPCPLDELPIQYGDFAVWQRDWIASDSFDEQLEYWKGQLGDELPALEIPTDFPRGKSRTSFGGIESFLLPSALTRAIKALAQRDDATPYMIFLAAFNVLLHKYCGQDRILIGSPTANRVPTETESLIGAFANTLLLTSDLSGNPSFSEHLQRVKDVAFGAFSNQTLPFEKLVEKIRPARGRNRTQLFQVLFIYQTAFMQPVELDDLTITPIRSVSPGSTFELSLGIVERSEGTRLQLEYNTDLFKAETIRRMLDDLRTILRSAILDSHRKLSELVLARQDAVSPVDETSVGVSEFSLGATVTSNGNKSPGANHSNGYGNIKSIAATNGNGKLASLPPQTAAVPETVDEKVRIEEVLKEIWREMMHLDSVSIDDDFFEIGGHSLLGAQIFGEIAKRLGVNLPLSALLNATTIRQLAELVRDARPKDVWTSLVPLNSKGTKPPFFLMHAAGGNVLFYKDLADSLGPDQPCYGMQAVGLGGHQSAYDRVEDMAAHYIQEIRNVQPKGPYYLGGSSIGGLIALEVASQFKQSGEEVGLVALFDTAAPGYPIVLRKSSRPVEALLSFADRIHHHIESLRLSKRGKRWPYIVAKATKAKNQTRRTYKRTKQKVARGVLTSLGRPLPEALVVTQNAIAVATRAYCPTQYDGDILLFRATKQQRGIQRDDTLGWSKFAAGNLDIHEVKGDHGSIVVEPRVRFVSAILSKRLGETPAVETGLQTTST